jgi:DNA-binding response OmpR family regulator
MGEKLENRQQEKTPPSSYAPAASTGAWKILVVEDDLSLRPFWEFLIKKNWPQAQLDWAVSGETAAEMLKTSQRFPPYDIVIADVFLSGALTGLDIVRQVYSSEWKHNCEVILSSACNTRQLKVHMAQLEVLAKVLTKPYESAFCVELIVSALDRLKRKQGGWIDT